MSRRTDDLYLVDLLDAADAIGRSLSGISFDQFLGQQEKRDAILWNLMIIGEACTRLSVEVTDELPDLPWELIRGFRNRVVHGYFALKWPIVWQIATDEIPGLREQTEERCWPRTTPGRTIGGKNRRPMARRLSRRDRCIPQAAIGYQGVKSNQQRDRADSSRLRTYFVIDNFGSSATEFSGSSSIRITARRS